MTAANNARKYTGWGLVHSSRAHSEVMLQAGLISMWNDAWGTIVDTESCDACNTWFRSASTQRQQQAPNPGEECSRSSEKIQYAHHHDGGKTQDYESTQYNWPNHIVEEAHLQPQG